MSRSHHFTSFCVILSGLAVFFAVEHTMFLLACCSLVPLFVAIDGGRLCGSRYAGMTGDWSLCVGRLPGMTGRGSGRRAWWTGFGMGLVISVCGFGWVIEGMQAFTGLSIAYGLGLFVLCALFFSCWWGALLWMLVALRALRRLGGAVGQALLAAAFWVLAETVLQRVGGGMPWFAFRLGNALSANLYAIQPVAWAGVSGPGFFVVVVNYLLAQAMVQRSRRLAGWALGAGILYMSWGWGLLIAFDRGQGGSGMSADRVPPSASAVVRGSGARRRMSEIRSFRLAILVENILPEVKWDEANGDRLVKGLLELERRAVAGEADVGLAGGTRPATEGEADAGLAGGGIAGEAEVGRGVGERSAKEKPVMMLWSESAIPWTYRPDDDLVKELLSVSAPAKITHVLGMNTDYAGNVVYNSAYCLLPDGVIAGRYDKRIPLAYIETPWCGMLLPFFSANGYSVQPGTREWPLATPYGNAGILICNESAVPAAAADMVRHGAQFLLNLSNDGWFRDTYIADQHFYNARLRAVETRKDVAINSNNGWSGLIRADGRVVEASRGEGVTILDVSVRPNDEGTPAVGYPDLPFYACLLFVLLSTIQPSTNKQHAMKSNVRSLLFFLLLFLLLSGTSGSVFANFSQAHWRWRKDNGSQTRAGWYSPQDFPTTNPFLPGRSMRLRIEIVNSLGNNETGMIGLQYQRGSSGAWIAVTNSVAGHDFVMAGSSPFVRDGEATTSQVRDDGAGTFAGGKVLVSTYQFPDTLDAGTKKEYEWDIRPTDSLARDSVYQFRMSFTGTTDGFNYVSPVPDMMLLSDHSIPVNPGIYKDPLVTGFFNRDSGWIASDGAGSIPLSDGRDLWAMDDSYINNYDTMAGTTGCLFQVRNSALVQPTGNWQWTKTATLTGSGPGIPSLFKNNSSDNYLLWPTGGYQRGDTVYVYCMNIMNSSGGLGFTSGGNDYLAKMVFPSLTVVGFDSLQSFNGITFGVGFDTAEQGNYIYTWGIQSAFIASNVVVARFPRNNPAAHWSFWNGSAWDTAIAHIAPIGTGASNGVYVAKVRNKYVLVSTEFAVSCDAGTHLYSATADSLTGPFSSQKALYTIPDNDLGHSPFWYAPFIHPEYINASNELLITYDINGYSNCEPACINNGFNPDYYRPRGLRVPLQLIDSSIAAYDHPGTFGGGPVGGHGDGGADGWKLHAWPNPAHGCINLSYEGCNSREAYLVIRNTTGQPVYANRIPLSGPTGTYTIYLPKGVGSGAYFLQMQSEADSRVVKVLLQ